MHAAVRSSVLSGATLLTAGAIAVTPIQPLAHVPSLPSISHAVSTAAVNLTSSPFDLYGQVLGTALYSAKGILAGRGEDVVELLESAIRP